MSQPAPAVLSVLHKCVVLGVAGEHAQTVPEFSAVVSGQISTGVTAAPTRPRPSTERIRVCLRMATGSVPALQLMRVGPAVTLIFLRALNNFLKRRGKSQFQELSLGVDRAGDVLVGMCGCGCVSRSSWLPTANRLSWPSFRDVPRAHAPPSCEGSPRVTPTPREELAACAIAIRAGARGPTNHAVPRCQPGLRLPVPRRASLAPRKPHFLTIACACGRRGTTRGRARWP